VEKFRKVQIKKVKRAAAAGDARQGPGELTRGGVRGGEA